MAEKKQIKTRTPFFREGLEAKAKSRYFKIGAAAAEIGVAIKRLRYNVVRRKVPATIVKKGNRIYYAFTTKQLAEAATFFSSN